MAPLRIEYPGALYHGTSRGNAKQKIFRNDRDRKVFLDIMGDVVERFHFICHAYCLMDNHYNLVIEIPVIARPDPKRWGQGGDMCSQR